MKKRNKGKELEKLAVRPFCIGIRRRGKLKSCPVCGNLLWKKERINMKRTKRMRIAALCLALALAAAVFAGCENYDVGKSPTPGLPDHTVDLPSLSPLPSGSTAAPKPSTTPANSPKPSASPAGTASPGTAD